jgi:hypothetical protein
LPPNTVTVGRNTTLLNRPAPAAPMFGDWQHRVRFAPVPYGDGGAKRAAFRKAIQAELANKFFYIN